MTPPLAALRLRDTHRLIPTRSPPVGILDVVASPEDLDLIIELEGWTNDRISAELGILPLLPPDEWVIGRPQATIIMAAFCHPRPGGSRFNGEDRGAWYAALDIDTAHAEIAYHRGREFEEIGVTDARVTMREYLADFDAEFHDVRAPDPANDPLHDPGSYAASQALAADLLAGGSNGVVYRSVRRPGGECIACFRPPLIANVRVAASFEYIWSGVGAPTIRELRSSI